MYGFVPGAGGRLFAVGELGLVQQRGSNGKWRVLPSATSGSGYLRGGIALPGGSSLIVVGGSGASTPAMRLTSEVLPRLGPKLAAVDTGIGGLGTLDGEAVGSFGTLSGGSLSSCIRFDFRGDLVADVTLSAATALLARTDSC